MRKKEEEELRSNREEGWSERRSKRKRGRGIGKEEIGEEEEEGRRGKEKGRRERKIREGRGGK